METPRPRLRRLRRAGLALSLVILAGLATLVLTRAAPALRHPAALLRLMREPKPRALPVPVRGVRPRDLRDSWGAPRPGGRRHQGIDIFAPRGAVVVSATEGIACKVGDNRLGGHVVRVLGPGLEWHYYAHLDSFADVHPGDIVRAGEVLGYVGDTGNARGTPTHLHYGIYSATGRATNPYPRLGPAREKGV